MSIHLIREESVDDNYNLDETNECDSVTWFDCEEPIFDVNS